MTRFASLLIVLFGLALPTLVKADPVTVFAAASLRGAVQEISGVSDQEVRLSFGGSGTMARQVAAGAPADVVILANDAWTDWLIAQGIKGLSAPTLIASNSLVLIGPKDAAPIASSQDIPARLGKGRLATGQRDAVPAGTYARQWLTTAGLWEKMLPSLAETDNVRAALALVARGDVPLGVVYASDALAEPLVDIVFSIPAETHDPIGYFAASLTPAGAAYVTMLTTPTAAAFFARHGFETVPQ